MDFKTVDGDLQIKNGGLEIASKLEADREYAGDIILHPKGSFGFNPALGAGAIELLNGPFREEEIKKRFRKNLVADDFEIHEIGVDPSTGKIPVNATREVI